MLVQRKWMYLESIFIGGDIRSQLPEEAKKFDNIDKMFKKVRTSTMNQSECQPHQHSESLVSQPAPAVPPVCVTCVCVCVCRS